MSKIGSKAAAWLAKKKQPAKPPEKIFSQLAKAIDKQAEHFGIDASHVAKRADVLAKMGLEPEDITPDLVHEAQAYHRHELRRITSALGAQYHP